MNENVNQIPQKENISEVIKKYKEQQNIQNHNLGNIPNPLVSKELINKSVMQKETDPDLLTSYEIVKLPTGGLLYPSRISELEVEYMTSEDEDLLTTPSLIENGTVLDVLLKRKIKTKGIDPKDLFSGDRNAVVLFLRTSSYGTEYTVEVTDPRNNETFKEKVDLLKLEYKGFGELPDENGYFNVFIPMRKKMIKFRLLTSGEDNLIFKKAEEIKLAYGEEFTKYSTMKLKSSIISIDGKTDRDYIDRFVNAMPALDAYTIRKKILDVTPDVNMKYKFKAKDGYEFDATLSVGLDFFSPNT